VDNICRKTYLSMCIDRVVEEGFIPLTPALYESTTVNQDEFISKMLPYVDAVFLFVNFGIDQCMFHIIDRAIDKKEIYYRRVAATQIAGLFFTPDTILLEVCLKTNFSIEAMRSKSRKREIVDARYVYYRRCRELTRASLAEIGRPVCRDHATVLHGCTEANNIKAVMDLYNKIYGPEDKPPAEKQLIPLPVSKPVLPFRSQDPREQDIPSGKTFLNTLADGDYNRPYSGYTPHR